jgi:hypothetical protein
VTRGSGRQGRQRRTPSAPSGPRRSEAGIGPRFTETIDADDLTGRFQRGQAIGALVGAAKAGLAIWERWRDRLTIPHEEGETKPEAGGRPAREDDDGS